MAWYPLRRDDAYCTPTRYSQLRRPLRAGELKRCEKRLPAVSSVSFD